MATNSRPTLFARLAGYVRFVFWTVLLALLVLVVFGSGNIEAQRTAQLAKMQDERKTHVIALIHRQDNVSILGVSVARYISIDDSEAILRAIRLTPDEEPIDLILHTPGGLVLAAEQIARALLEHHGKVTVFVPHFAMSGGTLIALAADEIVMDGNAVLGPLDPQLGTVAAASILRAVEQKPIDRVDDETLILADLARKAQAQVQAFVVEILEANGQMPADKVAETAKTLTDGRWTHDYPITVRLARTLGLNISTDVPRSVYELMDLYPQAPTRRPTVLYLEPPQPMRGGADERRGVPGREPGK